MADAVIRLEPEQWRSRRQAHERRVDDWLGPVRERRRAAEAHPVEDFLFTYYPYRPARLRRWHPGHGVLLVGARGLGRDYRDNPQGAIVDSRAVLARRGEAVARIRELLAATAARPPHLGCFGMHEWAMVYGLTQDQVRHHRWPLRLPPEQITAVVAERGVRCSHFDAFRFFTAPARRLNVLQPTRERAVELEQPGCLHTNMDLYKWAYKLLPLIPSELVLDCLALAWDIRTLDMRASPYDLTGLGYPPVPVETGAGRAEYAAAQRAFADRAAPLRERLLALLADVGPGRPAGPQAAGWRAS